MQVDLLNYAGNNMSGGSCLFEMKSEDDRLENACEPFNTNFFQNFQADGMGIYLSQTKPHEDEGDMMNDIEYIRPTIAPPDGEIDVPISMNNSLPSEHLSYDNDPQMHGVQCSGSSTLIALHKLGTYADNDVDDYDYASLEDDIDEVQGRVQVVPIELSLHKTSSHMYSELTPNTPTRGSLSPAHGGDSNHDKNNNNPSTINSRRSWQNASHIKKRPSKTSIMPNKRSRSHSEGDLKGSTGLVRPPPAPKKKEKKQRSLSVSSETGRHIINKLKSTSISNNDNSNANKLYKNEHDNNDKKIADDGKKKKKTKAAPIKVVTLGMLRFERCVILIFCFSTLPVSSFSSDCLLDLVQSYLWVFHPPLLLMRFFKKTTFLSCCFQAESLICATSSSSNKCCSRQES
eukprot:m.34490 g.34490  ORF g.34490 m.34490 type:complete len:402 (-) comp8740_c0_seq2:657-1862(-)